jgi:RNA polymerase sigma factor (sigma-70 family)
MARSSARPYSEALELLWGAGTCSALSDGQLLARFLATGDQAGELAFELLVKRHGAMVERVCSQILDDPGDVHDAWQAVFLVLARRAGAIRNRESVGGWLHGVAVRVANRTKATAIAHRVRERRASAAAAAKVFDANGGEIESCAIEREERAGVVHQEISRLPEKYRAPIVLCYMEGLTHDEAAASLSWPVGTVRSRLSRARDRLRERLSRRGLAAPAVAGPVGAWLAGKEAGSSALAGTFTGGSATVVPEGAAKLVLKLASQAANGSISGSTTVPVTSLILAEGVLKMMTFKKLTVIATVLLSLATLTAGGGLAVIRSSRAQQAPTREISVEEKKAPAASGQGVFLKNNDVDRQMQEMVELATIRYELVRQAFERGEISVEKLIDAGLELDKVELGAARNPAAARREIKERSFKRLEQLDRLMEIGVKEGKAKTADALAVKLRRMQAELDLKTPDNEKFDAPAILRRLNELEKRVLDLEKRVPRRGLGGSM